MYTLKFDITGDRELFERVSTSLRNPRELMEQIGVLALSSALGRLPSVLKQENSGIRSGMLAASLNATGPGGGTADTVFELSDHWVEVGSNLVYAAQVQFGGPIEPKNAKALAIPLIDALRRDGIGPRELDPNREILRFQPIRSSKPNVLGLLIDDAQELTGRQRKKRGGTPYGPGPLYVLVSWVRQEPRPFLFFDDEDKRVIDEELIPKWLKVKGQRS